MKLGTFKNYKDEKGNWKVAVAKIDKPILREVTIYVMAINLNKKLVNYLAVEVNNKELEEYGIIKLNSLFDIAYNRTKEKLETN